MLDAVRGLAARGTHAAVLFASGYAEAGETGRVKQEELARVARDSGILLLGPNCMGFTNFEVGVPVTSSRLLRSRPRAGPAWAWWRRAAPWRPMCAMR